jgi:hypothetical protein
VLLYDGSDPGVVALVDRMAPRLPLGVEAVDVSREPVDLPSLGITPSRLAGTVAWIRTDGVPAFDGEAVAHAVTTFTSRLSVLGHLALVPPLSWVAAVIYRRSVARGAGGLRSTSAIESSRTA